MKKAFKILYLLIFLLALAGCGSNTAPEEDDIYSLRLDGKRIGLETGSTYDADVSKAYPNAKKMFFDNTTDMIIALKANKIDAFIDDTPKVKLILQQDDSLAASDSGFENFDIAYSFARSPKGAILCGQFDKFIEQQEKNGTLDRLEKKWMGADESVKIPPEIGTLAGSHDVLDMAIESSSEPFAYIKDGKYAGYDIELAYLFCKENGYALSVKNMTFDAIIPALISDKCDFCGIGMTVTDERAEEIYFSKPIYVSGSSVVSLKVRDVKLSMGQRLKEGFEKTFIREERYRLFSQGLNVTVLITVASLILGTLLGFVFYAACRSGNKYANAIAGFLNFIITGTPEVVLLMVLFYVVFGKFAVDGVWIAVLCFTLTFGASVYSMIESGVSAISKGQKEAAYALGFSEQKTFYKIILPQAARSIIPAFRSELVSHIKNTAVVGYVAVQDLTKMGDIVRSRTYEAFFPLIAVTIIYFLLTAVLTFIVDVIDKSTNTKLRTKQQILKGIKTDDNT